MVKPEILEEKPITMAMANKILKEEDLNMLAGKAKEYLKEFAKLSPTKAEKLRKSLTALKIIRLRPEHIIKIVDILPEKAEDVALIMETYSITLTKKDQERIAKVVMEA